MALVSLVVKDLWAHGRFLGVRRSEVIEKKTERVGFEPTDPLGSHDFESCAFGHSATSPHTKELLQE